MDVEAMRHGILAFPGFVRSLGTRARPCVRQCRAHGLGVWNGSALDEGEDVGVDDVRVSGEHAVRVPLVDPDLGVREEFVLLDGCVLEGNDLVVVALEDEDRDRDGLEIFGLVGVGERFDALVVGECAWGSCRCPERLLTCDSAPTGLDSISRVRDVAILVAKTLRARCAAAEVERRLTMPVVTSPWGLQHRANRWRRS